MSNLHITEFFAAAADQRGPGSLPLAMVPPVAEQNIPIGATSVTSAKLNAATQIICLTPSADCHVAFDAEEGATADNMPLAAGRDYYFGVSNGIKIAVVGV